MKTNAQAPASPNVATHDFSHNVLMLGTFEVRDTEGSVHLPSDAQRLVAFLALRRKRMPRAFVAGTLWTDSSQKQAFGSLRSALWRLRDKAGAFVDADAESLVLAQDVSTDVQQAAATASRLCDRSDPCDSEQFAIDLFVDELLPGWYEEWVLLERERVRQQSLHALEAMAHRLSNEQHFAAAIEAALSAIALDPLRESAHRCLIEIHLKEGNRSEATRHFEQYKTRLRQMLGISPSDQITTMVSYGSATPR